MVAALDAKFSSRLRGYGDLKPIAYLYARGHDGHPRKKRILLSKRDNLLSSIIRRRRARNVLRCDPGRAAPTVADVCLGSHVLTRDRTARHVAGRAKRHNRPIERTPACLPPPAY